MQLGYATKPFLGWFSSKCTTDLLCVCKCIIPHLDAASFTIHENISDYNFVKLELSGHSLSSKSKKLFS